MLLARWNRCCGEPESFRTHLHGRDLVVCEDPAHADWHWSVTSPFGNVLAEGDAATRTLAEEAAEDEATAVHPPTPDLLEHLLG
jgi:hypothetical protein